jgi:energy-coupling factor transporter transmembrane protein EcfT
LAGNILYIPYTIFIIIGLIILVVVIKLKKGKRANRNFLIISMPIVILSQFYFWNSEFNNYVKSYLFASKVFECEYIEELKNMSIPLPKRTVFKGKEDICSPFYLAYVNTSDFISFYQEELKTLKDKEKIQKYIYIERKDNYWTENKGFAVELSSGSKIDIFIRRREGSGLISIVFEPNN